MREKEKRRREIKKLPSYLRIELGYKKTGASDCSGQLCMLIE